MGLTDTKEGWKNYVEELVDLMDDQAEQKRQGFANLSRGWAIGTEGWRKALAQDHAHRAIFPGIEAAQKCEMKEARWSLCLEALLSSAKRAPLDASTSPKGAPWKIELAKRLRLEEGAAITWIAQALHMGKSSAVRCYLHRKTA